MKPPRAKRILMTADAVGGVWVYATELTQMLCAAGTEVTLAVMGPAPRPEQLMPLRGIPRLQIEVTGLALEWMDPKGADLAHARIALPAIAERLQPDIVHLNSFREASFAWPSPVLVVAHSCVSTWWHACRPGVPLEPRWRNYAALVAAGLDAADAWIAPTAAFRDSMQAMYRPRQAGGVIHNGADVAFAVGAKEPFILAAGRLWDEAKNLATLAAAASELDWPVRVAGPASAPNAADAAPAFAGVEPLGELPRPLLLAQMQRAGIFAAPALYEPFGLGILEAAACGCALVLADIASLRELWNEAALFVPPHDSRAWTQALQQLCRHGHLRARLQQAARARAARYSLQAMAAAYDDLYAAMLSATTLTTASRSPATAERCA